jgi:hypothetical protein
VKTLPHHLQGALFQKVDAIYSGSLEKHSVPNLPSEDIDRDAILLTQTYQL